MNKKVDRMTNGELNSYLEAIKIIAQNAKTTEEIVKAIIQLQERLQE